MNCKTSFLNELCTSLTCDFSKNKTKPFIKMLNEISFSSLSSEKKKIVIFVNYLLGCIVNLVRDCNSVSIDSSNIV